MTANEVADYHRSFHLVDVDDPFLLLECLLKELLALENSTKRNQLVLKVLEIAIELNKRRDKERKEKERAEGLPVWPPQVTLFQLWRRKAFQTGYRSLDEIIRSTDDEEEFEYY